MNNEIEVTNKIIKVNQIFEVISYLEQLRNLYNNLIKQDKEKNKRLPYSEQRGNYMPYGESLPEKIQFELEYTDGRRNTQNDFEWFKHELDNPQYIKKIGIHLSISFYDNYDYYNEKIEKRLSPSVYINENTAYIISHSKNMDEEIYKVTTYIKGILCSNEDRYNKIIKNKSLIIYVFTLATGFILSYILILLIFIFRDSLKEISNLLFHNNIIFLLFQWVVSPLFSTIFSFNIISSLYEEIVPRKIYDHTTSDYKVIYKDDVEDYKKYCEVLIGKNTYNEEKRKSIKKIYETCKKIVLIQMVISMIIFIIMAII